MKKIVMALALMLLCSAVFAQLDLFQNIAENTDFKPDYKAGGWVEYNLTDADGEEATLKFSVLSGEPEGDEPFIFEYKITDSEGEWNLMQFQTEDPFDRDSYAYTIIQRKGDVARKMKIPKMQGTAEAASEDEEPELVFETLDGVIVEVPAGTFETTQLIVTDEDMNSNIWLTEEIPLFGLVKAEQEGEGKAELAAFGDDAESEIEGKVVDIQIPNLENLMKLAAPPQGN